MSLEINVCLGCHASYNDGYLFDKWYKCYDLDDLKDVIEIFKDHVLKSIKKERPEWVKDGYITEHYTEELYLADYEIYLDGEFLKCDFGESIWDLQQWVENVVGDLESMSSDEIELYNELLKNEDHEDALRIMKDAWAIEVGHNKHECIGYYFADLNCLFSDNNNSTLENYFDFESYGRDIYQESNTIEIGNKVYFVNY